MNKSAERRLKDLIDRYTAACPLSVVMCGDYGSDSLRRDFLEIRLHLQPWTDVRRWHSESVRIEMYPLRDLVFRRWTEVRVGQPEEVIPEFLDAEFEYRLSNAPTARMVQDEARSRRVLYQYFARDPHDRDK